MADYDDGKVACTGQELVIRGTGAAAVAALATAAPDHPDDL